MSGLGLMKGLGRFRLDSELNVFARYFNQAEKFITAEGVTYVKDTTNSNNLLLTNQNALLGDGVAYVAFSGLPTYDAVSAEKDGVTTDIAAEFSGANWTPANTAKYNNVIFKNAGVEVARFSLNEYESDALPTIITFHCAESGAMGVLTGSSANLSAADGLSSNFEKGFSSVVEADGVNDYIDTGVVPANTDIEIYFRLNNIAATQLIFGTFETGKVFRFGVTSTGLWFAVNSSTTYGAANKGWNKVKITADSKLYINDVLKDTGNQVLSGVPTVNLMLFCQNVNGAASSFAKMEMEYCKVWKDGILVRNYEIQSGLLIDTVNDVVYSNDGAGVLCHKRIPASLTDSSKSISGNTLQYPALNIESEQCLQMPVSDEAKKIDVDRVWFDIDGVQKDVPLSDLANTDYQTVVITNNQITDLSVKKIMSRLLPFQLIQSSAIYTDELDATTDWTHNGESLTVDSVTQYSGDGCLKLKSNAAGTSVQLQKTVAWNFTEAQFNNFKIWVYLHSDASNISQVQIQAAQSSALTDYYYVAYLGADLEQGRWVVLSGKPFVVGAGSPSYSNLNYFRVKVFKTDGTVAELSFDLNKIGETARPAFMITFDDGYLSDYEKAFPIMQSRNMVATSYVIKNAIGGDDKMNVAQLQTLNSAGWDIANHTTTHPLSPITKEAYIAEAEECRAYLDSVGLTRASRHVGYSASSYDANAHAAMQEWGALTAKRPGTAVSVYGRKYYPYAIQVLGTDYTTTYEDIKEYIDKALLSGGVPALLFHRLVETGAEGYSTLLSIFEDVIKYCDSLNLQSITINEYYRLYSNSIYVKHG